VETVHASGGRGELVSPIALAELAARALADPGVTGMVLTISRGGMPKGFPRGELLNEMKRNGVVERTYSFDPARVIAWLLRNDLVVMERTGERVLTFRPATPPNPAT
jgi:hypothetical protein